MKRLFLLLFAIGMVAMSSTSMAGMSNSRIRKETRFLTDKMAHELNMNTAQYNDAYEINYDFIASVGDLMDEVVRGYEWALNDYYEALDVRNDDFRWVLSDTQYRRFLGADYFYRPIYASGGRWNFRIYITYTNHNHFYFGRPYHYRTYCGGHHRTHYDNASYYRGRYNHSYYRGSHSVRSEKVYHNNRRSDFGSVSVRPNSSTRPSTSTRPGSSTRPSASTRPSSSSSGSSSSRRESTKSTKPSDSSRRENSSKGNSGSNSNSGSSNSGSSSSRRESTSGTSSGSSSSSSRRSTGSSVSKEKSAPRSSSSSESSRRSSSNSSSRTSEKDNGSSRR